MMSLLSAYKGLKQQTDEYHKMLLCGGLLSAYKGLKLLFIGFV